ncbi:hypothetical protein K466DRAFT_274761 [Polyporus arcularius HHB13444]|uniref:Uncharacterized protein n=1 Tax=Polyporus arcularius HHB13444 TaxID=1314778 RepID=A0A5C3PR51_9APHY|nr:hypothetical protein K466DRAFT_274761 [Polyporus arcularius HHB13444]
MHPALLDAAIIRAGSCAWLSASAASLRKPGILRTLAWLFAHSGVAPEVAEYHQNSERAGSVQLQNVIRDTHTLIIEVHLKVWNCMMDVVGKAGDDSEKLESPTSLVSQTPIDNRPYIYVHVAAYT